MMVWERRKTPGSNSNALQHGCVSNISMRNYFHCSAYHMRDWEPCPSDAQSTVRDDHTVKLESYGDSLKTCS